MSLDTTPLRFGKYKGRTPEDIADEDPRYILWLHETIKPRVVTTGLAAACEQDAREEEDEWNPDR